MLGNAVKQTTCCWGWQYTSVLSCGLPCWTSQTCSMWLMFSAVVLWDSGRLARLIAAAYPLKPCRTTAPVSLGKGAFGPPRKGCFAGRCPRAVLPLDIGLTLTQVGLPRVAPGGWLDSLLEGPWPARVDQSRIHTVSLGVWMVIGAALTQAGILNCLMSPGACQGGVGWGVCPRHLPAPRWVGACARGISQLPGGLGHEALAAPTPVVGLLLWTGLFSRFSGADSWCQPHQVS